MNSMQATMFPVVVAIVCLTSWGTADARCANGNTAICSGEQKDADKLGLLEVTPDKSSLGSSSTQRHDEVRTRTTSGNEEAT